MLIKFTTGRHQRISDSEFCARYPFKWIQFVSDRDRRQLGILLRRGNFQSGNGKPTLILHCLYQMSPLNHKRTSSSLPLPTYFKLQIMQLKDKRIPIIPLK